MRGAPHAWGGGPALGRAAAGRRVLLAVVLSHLVGDATGWVLWGAVQDSYSDWQGQYDLGQRVFRWSAAATADRRSGLQGGISWALHPDFCDRMLWLFPEDGWRRGGIDGAFSFLGCTDLRAAVAQAFDTWATNHPQISFFDATDDCALAGATSNGTCAAAEVLISTSEVVSIITDDQAAYVQPAIDDVDWTPQTTAGVTISGVGVRRADLTVSTRYCWYLDATFCQIFNGQKGSGEGAVLLVRVVVPKLTVPLKSPVTSAPPEASTAMPRP